VSLSAPAVRDRLKGLEDRGIIQGYWVSPDPSIFEREDLLVFFQGEKTREEALKTLEVHDVAWVAWKVEGGLTVGVWPRDRTAGIEELVEVVGGSQLGQAWSERHRKLSLSLADWRIMDKLIDEPRIGLEELCQFTGLSPKTVRKHLSSLLAEETIYVTPKIGSLADPGELVYHLAVTGKEGLSRLREALGDAVLVSQTDEPPMKHLLCRASNLADVTSRIGEAGKLPGVESVRVTLNRELLVATSFVHSLVHEKIQHSEKAWQ